MQGDKTTLVPEGEAFICETPRAIFLFFPLLVNLSAVLPADFAYTVLVGACAS